MESRLVWSDPGLPARGEDQVKATVYAASFRADGKQLVVAVSNLVLVFSGKDGELIHRLRGHKGTVYSVHYGRDRFSSGGADKTVIIWNDKGEGMLKFTHNESIQVVKYSPNGEKLASCTGTDFGLWSKEQKSVAKHKIPSKILSAAWTNDSQYLALGMTSGLIQIRDNKGHSFKSISKSAPVWCLAWSPSQNLHLENKSSHLGEILAVGAWDKTISFYRLSGEQVYKEQLLHYYPCTLDYISQGQYLLIGGSNRKLSLCTPEATRLSTICELPEKEWLMSMAVYHGKTTHLQKGQEPHIVVGAYGGAIQNYQIQFKAAFGLHSDRFAVREHMTDVLVQHTSIEKRVRIKSRDHVINVAIYKDCLGIQLPDRVNIYQVHQKASPHHEKSQDGTTSTTPPPVTDMHYRLRKERVFLKTETEMNTLLAVTAKHVLMSIKNKIQLYTPGKPKEREWILDDIVSYMTVDGGPAGKEGILLGLNNGAVLKIYVDNAFTIDLVPSVNRARGDILAMKSRHEDNKIVMLSISADREHLAVVNAMHELRIYELTAKSIVFSANCIDGVVFDPNLNDVFYFSRYGIEEIELKIGFDTTTSGIPQRTPGTVLGILGSKLFVVDNKELKAIDVPRSAALNQLIDSGNFHKAIQIATLGGSPGTSADWRRLANAAARSGNFSIAKHALARLRDLSGVDLLDTLELRRKQLVSSASSHTALTDQTNRRRNHPPPREQPSSPNAKINPKLIQLETIFKAELLARAGKYQEAAKTYTRAGDTESAVNLFVDLRRWDEAKIFAATGDTTKEIVRRQAAWAEETEDWAAAAEMYVSSGDPMRGVRLLGEHLGASKDDNTWLEQLAQLARTITGAPDVLKQCASYFEEADRYDLALETYRKLGDTKALVALHVRKEQWQEAITLAEQNSQLVDLPGLYTPYAEWLALADRFDEALDAYRKSGKPDQAQHMMQQLTLNAVIENRFKDASYYYWLLANESLKALSLNNQESESAAHALRTALPAYRYRLRNADVYYAYHLIDSFFLPFTPIQPETLFNAARFLINRLGNADAPPGISRAKILYTLATQAKHLGAFKLARFAYDKLQHMKLPEDLELDTLELDILAVRAKPLRDNPDLLPVCYRCGAANPLLNPAAHRHSAGKQSDAYFTGGHDVCTSCGHPFIRSFLDFDILPLVEFVPDSGIDDSTALDLIREPSLRSAPTSATSRLRSKHHDDDDDDDALSRQGASDDLFNKCIQRTLSNSTSGTSTPVTVDADTLRSLRREQVYVCKSITPDMRPTFYFNSLPDVHLAISNHRFFHEEDFEFEVLRQGRCPFSRVKAQDLGDTGPC